MSVDRLRHSKHAMTLINRSPLLGNGGVSNVSAGAVTSCNSEETAEAVFLRSPTRGSGARMEHVTPRLADSRGTVVGSFFCGSAPRLYNEDQLRLLSSRVVA
jgi:hypothetical protein